MNKKRLAPLLEKLRAKPKEARVQVSMVTALCVTGVIGLLWGATLPTRLEGLSKPSAVARSQDAEELATFLQGAQGNLGQVIGATVETPTDAAASDIQNTPPSSNAYRAGAPEPRTPGYNDDPFKKEETGVTPINRREVRISTTTSNSQD